MAVILHPAALRRSDKPAEINPGVARRRVTWFPVRKKSRLRGGLVGLLSGEGNSSIRKYGKSSSALAAVLRDTDFCDLHALYGLRRTVWFLTRGLRFFMDQLSRGKLLARCYCCFYRNTYGTARRRDLDRCSIVDFRKPRSVPLNPRLLGCRSAYLSRGVVRLMTKGSIRYRKAYP
jgi:hypothetical protein